MPRLVASVRQDGWFPISTDPDGEALSLREFKVCPSCLADLRFDGFLADMPAQLQTAIVDAFTVARFFQHYPGALADGGLDILVPGISGAV